MTHQDSTASAAAPPVGTASGATPLASRVLRNLVSKVLGEAGSRLVSFGFNVALAHGLGSAAYGRYSLAYAFAGILAMCGELGLNTLLTQKVAGDRAAAGELLARFAPLRWISVALTFVATVLLARAGGDPDRADEIMLMALFMAGNTLLDYHTAVLNAFERMGHEAAMRVTTRLLVSGAGIAAVLAGAPLLQVIAAVALANLVSAGLGSALRASLGIRFRARFDLRFTARTLKAAIPVSVAWLGMVLYFYMDPLVLELLGFDAAAIGQYGAASKILEAAQAAPLILVGGTFPVVAQLAGSDRPSAAAPFFGWANRLCLVLGVPLAAIGALLSPTVATLLYGPTFPETGLSLALLALAAPLFFANLVAIYYLLAMGRRWEAALFRGGSCLLKLAAMVPCTRALGPAGAALAFLAADGLLFGALLIWRRREGLLEHGEVALLAKVLLAVGAGGGGWMLVRGLALPAQLATVTIPLLAVLGAAGLLNRRVALLERPEPRS